jgi:hypothetical protein
MAQKILLRRGGLASVNSGATISVTQGEQLFASGSLTNTTIGNVVFVATGTGNGQFTSVGKLYSGTAAADGFDSKLDGLPYYKTDEQALYKLGDSSALDLSGNLEGTIISSIEASGSFSGSFVGDGSNLTGLNVGSIAAPGNDTELIFNNGGAFGASSDLTFDGSVLDVTGTISGSALYLSGNANIDGNIVLGGNITIGDANTDTIALGGEFTSNLVPDVDGTYDLGTTAKRWQHVYADAATITGDLDASDVTIDAWGSVSASLQSIQAGANALTLQDVTENGATTDQTVTVDNLIVTNIAAGTDNTVVILNSSNQLETDEIDSRVWGTTLVGTSDTPADNQLAIFTDANTVEGSADVTYDGTTFTVTADIDANDVTIDDWGSVSASLASIESNAAAAGLQEVTDINSATTNDITVRNIQIGVDAADEISTSTGNLILDSAGGTVQVDDNLVVVGNLEVQGTTTTVDSTTIQLGDNIIELNGSGAVNGGLLVTDVTAPNTASGSLLWDSTNDYWKGGALGSEKEFARFNTDPTSNAVTKVNASGLLVDSNISDDGSAVTVSIGLTAAGLTDSTSAAATRFSYINASKRHAYVTPANAGEVLQWDGSAMVASNVIDGGSF